MKKVLVIGGTYFLGRVFCMMAAQREDIELSVLNRGTYQLHMQDVKEYRVDRHEMAKMNEMLPDGEGYDAVVDFCAYFPEEIKMIIDSVPGQIKQYIYVSTGSVYEQSDEKRAENAPVVSKPPRDKVEQHVQYKLALEKELFDVCSENGIRPTVMRPACLYGPFNYVPREAFFFNSIFQGAAVPYPTDATSRFSMAYVGDVAMAILNAIGNEKAYGEIFNVAGEEEISYEMIMNLLHSFAGDFKTEGMTVEQIIEKRVPLAFPMNRNELFDGSKAKELLGVDYTSFESGMDISYRIHKDLYEESLFERGGCGGGCSCGSCGDGCGDGCGEGCCE